MSHHPNPRPNPLAKGIIELKLDPQQQTSLGNITGKIVPHIEGYIKKGTLVVTNINISSTEFKHAWNAFDDEAWMKKDNNNNNNE